MRPDAILFLCALAVLALLGLLYVLIQARRNDGIALLPSGIVGFLTGGFDGLTLTPNLMIVARDYINLPALIAHERVHQEQMRRDGTLTFWRRYITSKSARLDYEIEAYRAWLQHSPDDMWRVVGMLQGYGVALTYEEALALLDSKAPHAT